MSDIEETPVENQQPEVEDTAKKPKKGVMTAKKLEDLEEARATRKANLNTRKYSQEKRSAAEMRAEEEIQRRASELAEQKALEIIERRKQEEELAEYRAWKKAQEEQNEDNPKKKTAKKSAKNNQDDAKKQAPPKQPAKKRTPKKRQVESDSDSDRDQGFQNDQPYPPQSHDWLSSVLD
ncbi:hypothetical protein HDV00_009456 [Rhizophlyctis rosea]|nr:hypothetical protein HDV00_009456 [Rhizophlyctis rosea]